MGRIIQKASDKEEMLIPKLKQKRQKKDLDRIHSKMLKAKKNLDKIGKDGNRNGQKQGQAKICSRLLPRFAAGIYRNGAKGKDIQKAKTSENTFNKARLKADALELFNGDTPESTCIVEIPLHDENKQSSNKCFVKNSLEWTPCILEQSPILSKRQSQNQKLCLIKKKGEENFFENLDLNKIKKNVNNESKYAIQKEDLCKRRLFQNDREQLEAITTIQTQIFDDIDLTKENRVHEKKAQRTGSENSKTISPLNYYMKLCKRISAENFEGDFLQTYQSDPLTTTIKKLRHAYADSFRQHLLREKKQELINVESSPFVLEYQDCTYSDISQLSSVEFEVPKCNENHTTVARLQEGISQKDKFHYAELKKRGDAMHYNSTAYLRNSSVAYNASSSIKENRESINNQRIKQSLDIYQSPKPVNLYFVNEKDSAELDSQKNRNYGNHTSKNKRHNKDNFYIDIPDYENSQYIDNTKHLRHSIFTNDPILPAERHLSKDYTCEKLSTAISDNPAPSNISQKYKDKTTNKCNIKNVKRIPPILRRCSNIIIDKNNPIQINDNYTEGLHKKFETKFNGNPGNGIVEKFYEIGLPNMFENLPTHNNACNNSNSIADVPFDRTKILEPQIGSMKIKDSQESQIETFDMNIRPNKLNGENRFCRFDNSLHPQTCEVSCNTNVYTDKLIQQEQVIPNMKKHIFHSNNYRPINYLQSSNSSVQQAKRSQRTKLHMCETNNSKQELFEKNTCDQNQNILFNVNDRAMSTTMLNFSQNIQTDKRSREPREMFGKTGVEGTKNQINQNACRCNERYIYFDSTNCPRKCNVSQAHHLQEETAQTMAQPEILCDIKGYDNSIDNCINLSNAIRQNVPLSLEQKHHLYRYSKMINENGQHRAMLLQNVTQPIKYLAVKNGLDIQRIPVYINDGTVRITENVPLKVVALMDPNIQTNAFPQEVTAQVIPLQINNPQFNDFATHAKNNQSFVRHVDSVNAIVLNTDSQPTWYASNL